MKSRRALAGPRRLVLLYGTLLLVAAGCGDNRWRDALQPLPEVSLARREAADAEALRAVRQRLDRVLAMPSLSRAEAARAWLELGRHYLAHEFDGAARVALGNALIAEPNQREAHYLLAILLQREGLLAEARAHLLAALELAPGDGYSLLRLGDIALAQHQLAQAQGYYEQAQTRERTAVSARAGLGRVALAAGDYPAAITHLRHALAQQPAASILRHPLAQALRESGDDAAAREELALAGNQPLVQVDPLLDALSELVRGARSLLTRGHRAKAAGDTELAETLYRQAMETDPGYALAPHALGLLLVETARSTEALAAFELAVQLDPAFPEAWFNLATARLREGQIDAADVAYQKVLAIDPGHQQARLRHAAILHQRGDTAASRSELERILQTDPTQLEAVQSLVMLEMAEGRAAIAATVLDRALLAGQDGQVRAELQLLVAHLATSRGDPAAAAAAYRAALQADRQHPMAWYNLGQLQRAAGDTAAAIDSLREAARLRPDDHRFQHALVSVLRASGAWQAARQALEEALRHRSDEPTLSASLIELLAACPVEELRDGTRALELAQQLARERRDPRFIELTAMALAELGHFDQAADLIRRMLEAPQTREAPAEVQARLRQAQGAYTAKRPWRLD